MALATKEWECVRQGVHLSTCSEGPMRSLVVIFAVVIATAPLIPLGTPPAFAAGAVDPTISVQKSKKNKNKYADVKVTVNSFSNPRRGEDSVMVTASLSATGLTCKMVIRYLDDGGEDSPDDVLADPSGVCTFHFDVPDKKDVVGDAQIVIKAIDLTGKQRGEGKRDFDVRS
jgi:hypothetical protein